MLTPVTSVPILAILKINNGVIRRFGATLQKHQFFSAVIIFDDLRLNTLKTML